MLRRYLRARTQTLKSPLAALSFIALAGLAAPALAQMRTSCPNFGATAAGSPMRLELNRVHTHHNGCEDDPLPVTEAVPGTTINGCYGSDEVDPMGNHLGENTVCTVCQPGQAGCYVYSPPLPMPGPIFIPTNLPPFNPFPVDPENPDPWGVPDNPWDELPDDAPPWMPKYGPPGCLGFWYLPG